jgi:hypothetical protein
VSLFQGVQQHEPTAHGTCRTLLQCRSVPTDSNLVTEILCISQRLTLKKSTIFRRPDLPPFSGGTGKEDNQMYCSVRKTSNHELRLSLSNGPTSVDSSLFPLYLTTEADPASEMLWVSLV